MEQCMTMLFCFKLGKSAKETREILTTVYEELAVILKNAYEWFQCFREGQDTMEDFHWTGQSETVHTPDNVQKLKELLSQDRRATVRMIVLEAGVGRDTAHCILIQDLDKRKLCPTLRWQNKCNFGLVPATLMALVAFCMPILKFSARQQ